MTGGFWREEASKAGSGFRPVRQFFLRASTSLLALALSSAIAPAAFAESIAWVGSSSDDWFSPSSWFGYTRVPGANDLAAIDAQGPTIAAGRVAEIDELGIGITLDGSLSVEGGLKTSNTKLGNKDLVAGTLNFSGGDWSNKHDIFIGGVGIGEVSLTGSRAVSGGNVYLGGGSGHGWLTLDNLSSFDNTGTTFVGVAADDDFDQLQILGASTFRTGGFAIADGMDSVGTVSVEGNGSSLTVSQDMVIGHGGNGLLTISSGGVVKSLATTIIGNLATSSGGSLTVNGRGSILETSGPLIVGNESSASMFIGTAAEVISGAVVIGRHSVGRATVTGSDSRWITGNLSIGGDENDPGGAIGDGAVDVMAGAAINSASVQLGAVSGARGSATVEGADSAWTIGDDGLSVGLSGSGSLSVKAGGHVDSVNTVVGAKEGSDGSITVSGSGSTFNNAGDLDVGWEGDASLHVDTGGTVTSDSAIVGTKSMIAAVNISGGGSTLTLAKTLIVGYENATTGEVSVTTGGEIRAKELSIGELGGSSGKLSVIGAGSIVTVSVDSNLVNSGSTYVGWRGGGNLTVTDAGSLGTNRLFVGTQAGSNGFLHVGGIGSQVEVHDALVIGGGGNGSVEVTGGGALAAHTIVIAAAAGSTGVLNIGARAGLTARAAGEVDAAGIVFGAGNGSIVFNHSEADYSLSANISGTGRVVAENGVTTLAGHNSYSGGTTISAGTLKGTATSFGSGQIANNGQLVVDGAGTLSNSLTGSGTVEKTGSGNLVLAGNNSYSGITTISAGTLTGAARSFGSGQIVNDAQLVVDGAGTFSNVVSGTGTFEKTGDGNLVVTGNSTYSGATEVSSGKLSVNGSLASAVSVRSGATLGGSGTIGGLTVASGGTLSPGNSIGTLTSTGDVRFFSGSTYTVEIDASGNSDRIAVAGAVTIDNNVKLVVTPLASHSAYSLGTQYPILTAMGGIAGTFSGVDEKFAYLVVSVTKSTDNGTAYLSFNRASPDSGLLASETSSENAQNAANAVEAAREDPALYQAALFLGQNETQSAFSQLAGELHPSLAMALINRSQLTRAVILERLRSAFDGVDARAIMPAGNATGGSGTQRVDEGSLTFWSNGFGSRGRVDGDRNGATVDIKGKGVLIGLDGDLDDGVRAGVAAGYGHDSISQKSASADVDSYYVAAYAGLTNGPVSLRLGATHAFQDIDTRRALSFSTLQENLTASYGASTTQAFAEAAWRFDLDRTVIEPYANVSYVNLETEAFGERGGVAAVSSGSASHDQLYTTLGARLRQDISLDDMSGQATFDIGWRHAYGDPSVVSTLFYTGGDGFSVAGTAMTQDAALLNLGLSYDLAPSATLTFRYGAVFGAGVLDQSASAELGVRF